MILMLMAAIPLGALCGFAADELLRGRDPRASVVILAGVAGAIAGVLAHRWAGVDGGMVVDALWALAGAIALASAVRVRISAGIVHAF